MESWVGGVKKNFACGVQGRRGEEELRCGVQGGRGEEGTSFEESRAGGVRRRLCLRSTGWEG